MHPEELCVMLLRVGAKNTDKTTENNLQQKQCKNKRDLPEPKVCSLCERFLDGVIETLLGVGMFLMFVCLFVFPERMVVVATTKKGGGGGGV